MIRAPEHSRARAILVLAILASACGSPESATEPDPVVLNHVGGATCAKCHQEEADLWSGSHHDLAMQEATAATVLGDFEGATFTYAGVTSTFSRQGDSFRVETDGPDGRLTEYEVAYTFGVEPLQQYLMAFPNGRLQALNVVWDTRSESEGGQRWYHLYPDEAIDHRDPLHWTGIYQNWNHACAECHSTDYRKGYDVATDSFESTWSEIDVSCEACHGPGSQHVAWAEVHERGETTEGDDLGLVVDLKDRNGGVWEIQPETGLAARSVERSSRQQIETCARCHARRATLATEYEHGRPLLDTHRLALLEEGLYHPDGQILDEVYVYGSFLQSVMYEHGVTCSDCHDPHGLRIASPDAVCAKCHAPERFAVTEHHFHPPRSAGASCVECHMGSRDYMVVDGRRDHYFRVPRPDLSIESGAPSTCAGCHSDRSASWLVEKYQEWYGTPDHRNYGQILALGRRGGPGATEALESFANDAEMPALARATALSLLGRQLRRSSILVLERALGDDSPLVRFGAVQALDGLPPEVLWRLGAPLLTDPVRGVRLEVVQRLAAVPPEARRGSPAAAFERAVAEFRQSYEAHADRARAQLSLGTLAGQLGDPKKAESSFRRALTLDPKYAPAYANLADLYRALGRDRDADSVLQQGMEMLPDDGSLRHAYGLFLVRQGRRVEARAELARAAELRPDIARYGYVLAVAIQSAGDTQGAIEVLEGVHFEHPGDAEVLSALIGYLREVGAMESAQSYSAKLRELQAETDGR